MRKPKVLIFTPTYEGKHYCFNEFIDHCSKLTYPNIKHIIVDNSKTDEYANKLKRKLSKTNIDVYHVDRGNNSREALARSQNFARRMAIEGEYDYIFSLESDVFTPYNVIECLMIQGKPIIGALYFIGDKNSQERIPCITISKYLEEKGHYGTRLLEPKEFYDYLNRGVKQVQSCGLGATLIRRDIFTKFPFNYDPRFMGHSDIYYYNKLFQALIPAYVHTDLVCDHRNVPWSTVKDR